MPWRVKKAGRGYVATHPAIGSTCSWPTRQSALAAAALVEQAHERETERQNREAVASSGSIRPWLFQYWKSRADRRQIRAGVTMTVD